MRTNNFFAKKKSAQAMVEFAIVLPILLLLLYGILETGRYLFIYSSIVTASRQAARYGSATGLGSGTVPRYQDCAGIRSAAQKADFLNAFDDADIHIYHDNGPNPRAPTGSGLSETEYCTGSVAVDTGWAPTGNNNRIVVKIRGGFTGIVPKLVPFINRNKAINPIRGESARTILVSVSIQVTAPPITFRASSPTPTATITNTPTKTPTPPITPTSTRTFTPTITPLFSFTPSKTPTTTQTSTATISPTATVQPSATVSPTKTATDLPNCNSITVQHGPLTISGTMSMSVTNNTGVPLLVRDVFVDWYNDKGHKTGSDKTLILQSATLGGVTFFTGNLFASSTTVTPSGLYVPTGTSSIIFTFHQVYDSPDGSEKIIISLATNGCGSVTIDSSN
jgi:hypothetical protein